MGGAQVVLGDRQHPARATGWVEQRLHDAGLGEQVVVLDEQQPHHQLDHLTRREVLTSRLVRELREAADQLLVQVAHLDVRHDLGVQVDLGELRHHHVEQVRVVEPGDLHVEVELVDHVPSAGREPGDVAAQVPGDVARVVEQPAEVELRGVEERLPGGGSQDRLTVAMLGVLGEHLRLGRLQHAVEAAEHDQRQDHLAVLGLLVVPRSRSATDQMNAAWFLIVASDTALPKFQPAGTPRDRLPAYSSRGGHAGL